MKEKIILQLRGSLMGFNIGTGFISIWTQMMLASLAAVFLLLSERVTAADVVEFTEHSYTSELNPAIARRKLRESAIKTLSIRLIKGILGEANLKKKYKKIEKKIIKKSKRYILSQRSGSLELSKDEKSYGMSIDFRVSAENLRALLLAEGLMYSMESLPTILPMVSFKDRVNLRSLSWWAETPQKEQLPLANLLRRLHESVHDNMFKKGFYVQTPLTSQLHYLVPAVFRQDNISNSEAMFLGQHFGSSIVLRGSLQMSTEGALKDYFSIRVRLEAYQTNNGRIIAEVIRNYVTEVGPVWAVVDKKISEVVDRLGNDLALQIEDSWKRGTFGSSLLQVKFKGKFNYHRFSVLKKVVQANVNEIRVMRERKFGPESIVFEMDVSTGAQKLAEVFETRNFAPFRLKIDKVVGQNIDLSVVSM